MTCIADSDRRTRVQRARLPSLTSEEESFHLFTPAKPRPNDIIFSSERSRDRTMGSISGSRSLSASRSLSVRRTGFSVPMRDKTGRKEDEQQAAKKGKRGVFRSLEPFCTDHSSSCLLFRSGCFALASCSCGKSVARTAKTHTAFDRESHIHSSP